VKEWLLSDKIGFIGYGKMADAIGVALHESLSDQYSMIATEPNSERQDWIKADRQFVDLLSLDALVHQSSVIFLAIKPQQLSELASELSASFQPNQLIISMLAGVSVGECQRLLNHSNIIRIMPNMPAILKQGVTGM
jgi:pyrroline-5-carboxylate reductase